MLQEKFQILKQVKKDKQKNIKTLTKDKLNGPKLNQVANQETHGRTKNQYIITKDYRRQEKKKGSINALISNRRNTYKIIL